MAQARRLLDRELVAASLEGADVGDARLGEDLRAALLGQVEVVLVEGVLRAVAAAHHAPAAERAARARRALAAEVRIGLLHAVLAEIDADRRPVERVPAAHLVGHLLEHPIGLDHHLARHGTEHAQRRVVVRAERFLPVEPDPLGIAERLVRGDEQRVRVDEASAADAAPVEDEDVAQDRELQDAVEALGRAPHRLSKVPVGLREVLGSPALAHLEDGDRVALLREAQRRDAAAEARSDDREVVVEGVHGALRGGRAWGPRLSPCRRAWGSAPRGWRPRCRRRGRPRWTAPPAPARR